MPTQANAWMTVNHGRLSIAVPSSWSDASTIMLTGPSQRLPGARMTATTGREFASNVSLVMVTRPPNGTVESYHAAAAESLRLQNTAHRLLEMKPIVLAGGRGVAALRNVFINGAWVRQLQAVVSVEEVFVIITVSTLDGAPTSEWETLETILASVELTRGATTITPEKELS